MPRLITALLIAAGTVPPAQADDRPMILRERAEATLQGGAFSFQLLRIRGYEIDILLAGARRTIRLGRSFPSPDGTCRVTFHKVSPETRIARFRTDCP